MYCSTSVLNSTDVPVCMAGVYELMRLVLSTGYIYLLVKVLVIVSFKIKGNSWSTVESETRVVVTCNCKLLATDSLEI